MRKLILLLFPLLAQPGYATNYAKKHINPLEQPYKIAILDSGYDLERALYPIKLCKTGHYNYGTREARVGSDPQEKHGSYVATIIGSILRDVNYCAVIFQIADPQEGFTTDNVVDALKRAREAGVGAINISFRSGAYEWAEYQELQRASDAGIKIFVAAGNEAMNFNIICNTYPACYNLKNLITVGALTTDGDAVSSYSNYGTKVNLWYPGDLTTPFFQMRGTSFAAPRALGYYVRQLYQQQHARPGQ